MGMDPSVRFAFFFLSFIFHVTLGLKSKLSRFDVSSTGMRSVIGFLYKKITCKFGINIYAKAEYTKDIVQ